MQEDTAIRAALIERAEHHNFIPHSLRDAYADALLAYYRTMAKKQTRGD
jgi:hypothetical protein